MLTVHREKICFDGALPVLKRETRLSRLEKYRVKLELLRSKTQHAAPPHGDIKNGRGIDPRKLMCSRSVPLRYKDFPENPFMVSAVFEDLKFRWSKRAILEAIGDTFVANSISLEDYPWADITELVPGEADVECAQISRSSGCAVLTNDSDLVVHDLGTRGSVVFMDSIEINKWNPFNPAESMIKALRLCPSILTRQLGVTSIQHFAYELDQNPRSGLAELIQQAKGASEDTPRYRLFIKEYDAEPNDLPIEPICRGVSQSLDTRVSEIFWQYNLRDVYMPDGTPHIYLGILNEDPTRKCAWEHGRLYRNLGYSILNTSYCSSQRSTSICEYIRRGSRIAVDRVTLGNPKWIATAMRSVCERLAMAQTVFDGHLSSPASWEALALCEVYSAKVTMEVSLPDEEQLRRFFRLGYIGKKFDWPDIHLVAETQAVLYSLRILKQLLDVTDHQGEPALRTRSILAGLPPLCVLMRSRYEMTEEHPGYDEDRFEDRFFQLWEGTFGARPSQPIPLSQKQNESSNRTKPVRQAQQIGGGIERPANIFELLSE